jgi:glutamate carboxypeptidase
VTDRVRASDLVSDAEIGALHGSLAADLPAFLADLERLVNVDCGSYSPDGVNEVASWVAAFLERLGARVERRPDPTGRFGDTVVATLDGPTDGPTDGPHVLLVGHTDTVFPDGTAAERPFRVGDGRALGPGVSDMKGGLLGGLYAIAALRRLRAGTPGFDGPARITFIANPDEEVGSPSSTPHIRAAASEADAAFVLEGARANGDIVSSRKGIIDARLTVHGRAAHAGVEPEKGRSAILAGAELVRGIHALNGRWPGVTANVGVFRSGTRPNVVPDRAELEVDVRAETADTLAAAAAALAELAAAPALPDVSIELETTHSWAPMEKLERSGRLVEAAIELARRIGFETRGAATGGASDANTTAGLGVPTIDGLGPVGGADHSPFEYLEIASIVPRATLVAALILAVGRDPRAAAGRAR